MSGGAHLLSFTGTDTIPAIDFLEEYYFANSEMELVGGSVPATEHSVMSMGLKDEEIGTFERIFTKIYPSGIVSIVSDTWDYWRVLGEFLPKLKDKILNRDGKVVIRPDSSPKTPVEIICGDPSAKAGSLEHKGSIEVLWDIFGGQMNSKGYKQLDAHIGLIYGDSITYERAKAICEGLKAKGFASTNVVYGIGSYTYQYVTRDTYGFAMKATYGEVEGEGREIFKDPKTDNGMKKSARGLLAINKVNNKYVLTDRVTREKSEAGELVEVFCDGRVMKNYSLREIRFRLRDEMNNRRK
jgi:nicotinamide phosphoribosyltransferase